MLNILEALTQPQPKKKTQRKHPHNTATVVFSKLSGMRMQQECWESHRIQPIPPVSPVTRIPIR